VKRRSVLDNFGVEKFEQENVESMNSEDEKSLRAVFTVLL
jgi:hypothetical protein